MGVGSWWRRRGAGSGEALDPAAPATAARARQVGDQLTIHEYRHAAVTADGVIAARTFVTEGIAAVGAQEIRVTAPADWDERAIGVITTLLAKLARFAAEGEPAVLGGFTGFHNQGLPGVDHVGVLYARGTEVAGIPGAETALVAVLLHPDELALVQRGLATRVLACLSLRARVFPYPACWEVRQAPVLSPADHAESTLARIAPQATLGDVRVTVVTDGPTPAASTEAVAIVSLPARAARRLAAEWLPSAPRMLVLLAQPAPDLDGLKVWVPGSDEPTAAVATSEVHRMGCAFVALAGVDGQAPALKHLEDGVTVLLDPARFDQVRAALTAGDDLSLELDGGAALRIEFRPDDVLDDPFTGATLRAAGGWERRRPGSPAPPPEGRARLDQVVLLVPDEVLRARVAVDELAAFVRAIVPIVDRVADDHPPVETLSIKLGLSLAPGRGPEVEVASRGRAPAALFEELLEALQALAPPPVHGEVPFHVDLIVEPEPPPPSTS